MNPLPFKRSYACLAVVKNHLVVYRLPKLRSCVTLEESFETLGDDPALRIGKGTGATDASHIANQIPPQWRDFDRTDDAFSKHGHQPVICVYARRRTTWRPKTKTAVSTNPCCPKPFTPCRKEVFSYGEVDESGKLTGSGRSQSYTKELPGATPAMLPYLLNRVVFPLRIDMGFALNLQGSAFSEGID